MCILVFSTNFSEAFLIPRRSEPDKIKNVSLSSGKVHDILVRFSRNFYFLDKFSKNTQLSNFINIRLVRVELLLEGERTDRQT